MPLKRHFIQKGLLNAQIDEYLHKELVSAGYAGITMQKSPLGTRITVYAARPGLVIGKRGENVRALTTKLEEKFGLQKPVIDVAEVKEEQTSLNAQIMAERLASALVRGQHYRRATYGIVRRVIRSGARGIEISVNGKITSQRARSQRFKEGVVSKCGTPAIEHVSKGVAHCHLKPGVLGIKVKIMPSDVQMPDLVQILDKEPEKVEAPQVEREVPDDEEPADLGEREPSDEVDEDEEIDESDMFE
ncbi:MAG: 30S ribosomal protein S3 [Promethearchaeota archaeon]